MDDWSYEQLNNEFDNWMDYDENGFFDQDQLQDKTIHQQGPLSLTMADLMDQCIIPTLFQILQTLKFLFLFCFLLRVMASFIYSTLSSISDDIKSTFVHITSLCFGLALIFSICGIYAIYICMLPIIIYATLLVSLQTAKHYTGALVCGVSLIYVLTLELVVLASSASHQIRGSQMILAMKLISLAFDLTESNDRDNLNFVSYLGYCFCPATVIFGPWTSFKSYTTALIDSSFRFSFSWLFRVLLNTGEALTCFCISSCFCIWLIPDDYWLLLVAYRDAQSFRFSHYFISFVSETCLFIIGVYPSHKSAFVHHIARPFHIELPRSFVEVVVNWNLPLHHWLKTYVFRKTLTYGYFWAIFATYLASSLLHGLNFQLAAVLLSLGAYSYVEYGLRRKLSRAYDACILARKCKAKCDHKYTSNRFAVQLVNFGFGILSVFLLAYLGMLFDSSMLQEEGYTWWHVVIKWSEFGFVGHWVIFLFYMVSILI